MWSLSPVLALCSVCNFVAMCIALAVFLQLSINLPNIEMLIHSEKFLFLVIVIILIN